MMYRELVKLLNLMSESEIYELLYDVDIETRAILDEALMLFKAENQAKIQGGKL
jgi:hypothetical protein